MTHVDTQMISDHRRSVRLAKRPKDALERAGFKFINPPHPEELSYWAGEMNGIIYHVIQEQVKPWRYRVLAITKRRDTQVIWTTDIVEPTKEAVAKALEAAR